MNALVKGVPNPDIQVSKLCGGYLIAQATGSCVNNGFNAVNAEGTPFFPNILVADTMQIQSMDVDNSGSGEIPIVCWEKHPDEVLQDYISANICIPGTESGGYCQTDGLCQNNNWWLDEDGVVINLLYADYVGYQWDTKGQQKARSEKCYRCTPNQAVDCGFECTETTDLSLCAPIDAACDSDVGWTQ